MLTYYANNPPFATHVIPVAQFEQLIQSYIECYAAFANGGRLQKGDYEIAKHNLLAALDEIAADVNRVAQGNENVIIEGGFKPRKTTRSKPGLPAVPQIKKRYAATMAKYLPNATLAPVPSITPAL